MKESGLSERIGIHGYFSCGKISREVELRVRQQEEGEGSLELQPGVQDETAQVETDGKSRGNLLHV